MMRGGFGWGLYISLTLNEDQNEKLGFNNDSVRGLYKLQIEYILILQSEIFQT